MRACRSGSRVGASVCFVGGAFDEVAVLVVLGVEADRLATAAAFVLAVGLGRVSFDTAQRVRGCPRPARAAARDPELVQQHWQRRRITRIAGRQDQDLRQPTAVDQCMGLGRQATPGMTDGVIVRFVPATQRCFVIRPSPLCER